MFTVHFAQADQGFGRQVDRDLFTRWNWSRQVEKEAGAMRRLQANPKFLAIENRILHHPLQAVDFLPPPPQPGRPRPAWGAPGGSPFPRQRAGCAGSGAGKSRPACLPGTGQPSTPVLPAGCPCQRSAPPTPRPAPHIPRQVPPPGPPARRAAVPGGRQSKKLLPGHG